LLSAGLGECPDRRGSGVAGMTLFRRFVVVVSGIGMMAGPVLLLATPASATTATYNDPRPCSPSTNSGVCIAEVSAGDTASTITLSMVVGHATDPTTDLNWKSQNSNLNWNIYVNGESQSFSYVAHASDNAITPTGDIQGQFLGEVERYVQAPGLGSLPIQCDWTSGVTLQVDISTSEYGVSFPASCIGDPSSIAVQAVWTYDTSGGTGSAGPGGPVLTSTSPASASCCAVTPDVMTSTTTTTAAAVSNSTVPPTSTAPPTTVVATNGPSGGPTVSASSGSLAFTGPGSGVASVAVVGGALVLFGLVLLALFDAPRRMLKRLAYVRVSTRMQGWAKAAGKEVIRRTSWLLGR
jgi:hypothetical protein